MKSNICAAKEGRIAALTFENLEDLGLMCRRVHNSLRYEERRKIILMLKDNGPMTSREISLAIGKSQTYVHLNWLLAACLVCREKERPFRYSISGFLLQLFDLKLVYDQLCGKKNTNL
jgi:hypothetical protein